MSAPAVEPMFLRPAEAAALACLSTEPSRVRLWRLSRESGMTNTLRIAYRYADRRNASPS